MTVAYSTVVNPPMLPEVEMKKKTKKNAGTFVALLGSGAVASTVPQVVCPKIMKGMQKAGNFDAETTKTMHEAIKQMVVDNGLDKKGVRIRFLAPKEKVQGVVKRKISKPSNENLIKDLIDNIFIKSARNGENAFFCNKDLKLPTMKMSEFNKIMKEEGFAAAIKKLGENKAVYIKKNSIILPKEGIAAAGFHEVGHAMNHNLSKIGKMLQNCRNLYKFAPLIGIYAAFTKNSVAKDGEELTSGQKTKNFIRNNAGMLGFATALPMLIEEGMATVKGQKYANKVLPKDLAKKALKGNVIAYLSYLTVAISTGLATWSAVKIKDSIQAKKQAKQDAIEQARQKAIDDYNAQFAPLNPEPHTLVG